MQTRAHDAIVVGGGPAGSATAYGLSLAGADVLLLEKSRHPRNKLCAGVVTAKSMDVLKRVFNLGEEKLYGASCLYDAVYGFRAAYKSTPFFEGDSAYPFHFADRPVFDAHLLEMARQVGVHVIEEEPVAEVDCTLGTVKACSGKTYQGKVIVGADGIHSVVRKSFSQRVIPKKRWRGKMAATVEVFCERTDLPGCDDRLGIHFGYLKQGYAWVFPTKRKVITGICGLVRPGERTISESFKAFLKDLGYKGEVTLKGYPLPYGNYTATPVYRRAFLVGDAAGYADPLLGEGIFYALRSGELLINSLCQRRTTSGNAYIKAVAAHLLRDFFWAGMLRRMLLAWLQFAGPAAVRPVTALSERQILEIIHGKRSFTGFKKPVPQRD